MKQIYQTPILSQSIHHQINDAIAGFTHRKIWKDWGLDKLREQGVAILFHGAPGTGKTITAYFVAKKLHVWIKEISMADFGSQIPGQLARNIVKIFAVEQITAQAEHKHYPVILLDECDAMLVARDRLGPNMIWMLEPINMLLSQIAKYPGLVILATNHVHVLDWALERRLLAKINFGRPDYYLRLVMWKTKFPAKFPVQPTEDEYRQLANVDLTGADIESVFLLWAGQQAINLSANTGPQIQIKDLIEFIKAGHEKFYARHDRNGIQLPTTTEAIGFPK
jgi:AAA+ superfamily predicted ATPase